MSTRTDTIDDVVPSLIGREPVSITDLVRSGHRQWNSQERFGPFVERQINRANMGRERTVWTLSVSSEMNLAERIRMLSRQYHPELPVPVMVCSWVWTRSLGDGGSMNLAERQ